MLHSSSGPGHQILSLRIEGSTPSCSTRGSFEPFFYCILVEWELNCNLDGLGADNVGFCACIWE